MNFFQIISIMDGLGFAFIGEDVLISKRTDTGEILEKRNVCVFDAAHKSPTIEGIKDALKVAGVNKTKYIGLASAQYAPELKKIIIEI